MRSRTFRGLCCVLRDLAGLFRTFSPKGDPRFCNVCAKIFITASTCDRKWVRSALTKQRTPRRRDCLAGLSKGGHSCVAPQASWPPWRRLRFLLEASRPARAAPTKRRRQGIRLLPQLQARSREGLEEGRGRIQEEDGRRGQDPHRGGRKLRADAQDGNQQV